MMRCCIPGCLVKGVTMHRFPNPKQCMERFKLWLQIIGVDSLRELDPFIVYRHKRICFAHFETKYKSIGNPRLHKNAIPSFGLPAGEQSEDPLAIPKVSLAGAGSPTDAPISSQSSLPKNVQPQLVTPQLAKLQLTKLKSTKPLLAKLQLTKPQLTKPQLEKPQLLEQQVVKPLIAKSQLLKPLITKSQLLKPQLIKPVSSTKINLIKIKDKPRDKLSDNLFRPVVLDQQLPAKRKLQEIVNCIKIKDKPAVNLIRPVVLNQQFSKKRKSQETVNIIKNKDKPSDNLLRPIVLNQQLPKRRKLQGIVNAIKIKDTFSDNLLKPFVLDQEHSKKRNLEETEHLISDEMEDKYDNMLFSILGDVKSLPNFLDIVFGFLYRRTDYFQVSSEPNSGIGLPAGVAQRLLWKAFKQYECKQNTIKTPVAPASVIKETTPTLVKKDIVASAPVKTANLSLAQNVVGSFMNESDTANRTKLNQSIQTTCKNVLKNPVIIAKKEIRPFESYNGAVYENYAWSQSISDIDMQLKIPDMITCKELQIVVESSSMTVKLKNSSTVYLKGDLCRKCKVNETVWSLGGQILQIHLEKLSEGWWDCLLKSEPRLDFNKMDCSRPFHELSDEARAKIEQLTWDQERRQQGLPTSDQISLERTLKKAWKAEGSPFTGEYDPSKVSLN